MDESVPSWTGRAILHVDMDAFFASVEQLDHPEWRGRPVIVGGSPDGRGVVSAASYEARRFGVRSAMPSAQAARLCPDAVWAPARFDRYRELSRAVFALFGDITPDVEPMSVDEAYLDVTPATHGEDPVGVAQRIQSAVDELGLSCSIGVATSKSVAKIASDHRKPHGITVVPPGTERAFLAPLPVTALGGIGRSTAARLAGVGVRTLGDLAALDPATAGHLLGSAGTSLLERARGVDARPIDTGRERKSVSAEHTFSTDIHTRDEVEMHMRALVERVTSRLRRAGVAGRTVTVKLRFADFTTRTAQRTLAGPSDLGAELEPVALELLAEVWSVGTGLRLLGFGVSGLTDPSRQLDLFGADSDAVRHGELMRGIDAIRGRFGEGSISIGPPRRSSRERDEG
ncbi:MAG: DNA polymerase IV [Anaerosomatales bacterium]|nr:DNA polymerase IV [Anaerosomatales bacterium]